MQRGAVLRELERSIEQKLFLGAKQARSANGVKGTALRSFG